MWCQLPILKRPEKSKFYAELFFNQASFFVLSYSLPLALIVALYSVMLHTLWNKVTRLDLDLV